MDMVGSHGIRQLLNGTGITVGSLVPGMGATEGIWKAPFFPGMAKPSEKAEVQGVIAAAVLAASQDSVGNVVVFTGKNTKTAPRADQFAAIRKGFTDPCEALGGQMSLVDHAEATGVTMLLEPLNIKGEGPMRGHRDYLGWNPVELVEKVVKPIGSPRFKLVLDVYHTAMQSLNPADVISKIHDHIAYVHVAGLMGTPTGNHPQNRGELTLDGQVIDYPAVMEELAKHFSPGTMDVLFEYIPTFERCKSPDGAAAEVDRLTTDIDAAIELCESQTPKPAAASSQFGPVSACAGGSGG
jgi:sugar phosphate isomerase/epimerase